MTVTYETPHDGVAFITLNRPDRLNAYDAQMRLDLRNAMRDASHDDSIRAVVLTGAGRAFCAGADITAMEESMSVNVEDVLITEYAAFLNVMQSMPKPIIAAINGPAAGIGMTTALTCDLRVMGEGAYLMSAFANIGLVPDGGLTHLLPAQVGYARAFQVMIEAEKISPEKALDWGLVNRIAPDTDVVSNALAWAVSITEKAPIAMALTKRALRAATPGQREAIAYEAMLQREASKTEDFMEGVAAVLGKRKAEFKGR
ncbi:MAG: enoyl-CoA hydratase-related protein [Pseudomonadota bacterium]